MQEEEKKGFFANLSEKASDKIDEIQLKDAISKSFEMQATQFQNVEAQLLLGGKKFYGIYNKRRQQIRFRVEDKVEEREVFKNVSDSNDDQKYVIKKLSKDNIKDYMVQVKEVSYPVKCYVANVDII
ncbi:MAG: hypothetical protein WCX85_03500 [Bacilli bacterium]|jgi:hypothetical protein|nr:hypothetical protein [Bacilli bacterium]